MSGATGATGATGAGEEAEALAELLRELKERSGLSYGALAKRLHMSTSTLHRYCSGSAVPADYAPVERFARVCRASPEELVELHRRWILADAARGRKGPGPDGAARGAGAGEPGRAPAPDGLASGAGAPPPPPPAPAAPARGGGSRRCERRAVRNSGRDGAGIREQWPSRTRWKRRAACRRRVPVRSRAAPAAPHRAHRLRRRGRGSGSRRARRAPAVLRGRRR
ncbi:helix-turn-helix domain-containing protein [Streptomyces echinoruber]|uniref:helix-turn-helix domain-containing protein n=1 Tax=Streptomyces echinoruber TaxID=68898 RepID=UPI00361B59FD